MTAAINIDTTEHIECPITGACAHPSNIDELASLVASMDDVIASAKQTRAQAVAALVALTDAEGDTRKTRHLLGTKHTVKLTMPSGVDYDRGILRAAWKSADPVWRDRLLRVGSVEVQAREWAKWRNSASSDAAFCALRDAIKESERESQRAPSVKIEARGSERWRTMEAKP